MTKDSERCSEDPSEQSKLKKKKKERKQAVKAFSKEEGKKLGFSCLYLLEAEQTLWNLREVELTSEDIFGRWYVADFIYKYIQQKEEEKKNHSFQFLILLKYRVNKFWVFYLGKDWSTSAAS